MLRGHTCLLACMSERGEVYYDTRRSLRYRGYREVLEQLVVRLQGGR